MLDGRAFVTGAARSAGSGFGALGSWALARVRSAPACGDALTAFDNCTPF
jgi:hypothetical protein